MRARMTGVLFRRTVMPWQVGAARDLPLNETASWDGGEAAGAIFGWAGGDDFDAAKARKAFLVYQSDAADQRGSYKLPFARPESGGLTAILAGVNNAASRLSQTQIPEDVRPRARSVIDGYQAKKTESKAVTPAWFTRLRPADGELERRDAAAVEPNEDGFSGY